MGTAINTTEIGKNTNFAPDQFFVSEALANAGATTSGEFLFPQTLGECELKIVADGAVATGVGETLVISVQVASESGGTFAEVFAKTIAASTTIADGEDLAQYVAPREVEDCITKVVITSDYDASALSVNGIVIEV